MLEARTGWAGEGCARPLQDGREAHVRHPLYYNILDTLSILIIFL